MRARLSLALSLLTAVAIAGSARATVVALTATGTANVNSASAAQNFGGGFPPGYLTANGATNYGLMQFDLSPLAGVSVSQITSVQLRVFHVDGSDPSATFEVSQVIGAWVPLTVTFNSAPGSGPTVGNFSTSDSGHTWEVIDLLPSLVQSWLVTPISNDGISLARLSSGNPILEFAGSGFRNGACAPQLIVTFTGSSGGGGSEETCAAAPAVPEPLTLSLVAMGLVGAGFARRRRS